MINSGKVSLTMNHIGRYQADDLPYLFKQENFVKAVLILKSLTK